MAKIREILKGTESVPKNRRLSVEEKVGGVKLSEEERAMRAQVERELGERREKRIERLRRMFA